MTSPRPGSCSDNSKLLSDKVVNFVKQNPLVQESVNNFFDQPILIDTNFRSKFTQIAVHAQVPAVSGLKYDVLFIGTDDGRVLKVVNVGSDTGRVSQSVLVESVQAFPARQAIGNLLVYVPSPNGNSIATNELPSAVLLDDSLVAPDPLLSRLLVVSHDEIKSLPLHYCANMTTCSACVRLQDPYCAWDLRALKCVGKVDGDWLDSDYSQSIASGVSPLCPDGEIDDKLYLINELYPQQRAVVETPLIYTAESMAVGIVLTLAIASVLGFVIGYRLASMKAESANSSCASSALYETALLRSKVANNCDPTVPLTNHVDVYGCAPSQHSKLNDLVNVVVTIPETGKNDKNSFVLNNGTLPKDYKSRKVYL